jgi:hypothetical protein
MPYSAISLTSPEKSGFVSEIADVVTVVVVNVALVALEDAEDSFVDADEISLLLPASRRSLRDAPLFCDEHAKRESVKDTVKIKVKILFVLNMRTSSLVKSKRCAMIRSRVS